MKDKIQKSKIQNVWRPNIQVKTTNRIFKFPKKFSGSCWVKEGPQKSFLLYHVQGQARLNSDERNQAVDTWRVCRVLDLLGKRTKECVGYDENAL